MLLYLPRTEENFVYVVRAARTYAARRDPDAQIAVADHLRPLIEELWRDIEPEVTLASARPWRHVPMALEHARLIAQQPVGPFDMRFWSPWLADRMAYAGFWTGFYGRPGVPRALAITAPFMAAGGVLALWWAVRRWTRIIDRCVAALHAGWTNLPLGVEAPFLEQLRLRPPRVDTSNACYLSPRI